MTPFRSSLRKEAGMINQGMKLRLYPTPQQQEKIRQTLTANQLVYNETLAYLEKRKAAKLPVPTLTELKNYFLDFILVKETALRDFAPHLLFKSLYRAYDAFLAQKGSGPIRPEKPKDFRQKFTVDYSPGEVKVSQAKAKIYLPEFGILEAHGLYSFSGKITAVTLSLINHSEFFASLRIIGNIPSLWPLGTKELGLDLGISSLITTSDGMKYPFPRFNLADDKRVEALIKVLRTKKKGSKNYRKVCHKIGQIRLRMENRMKHYIDTITTALVKQSRLIAIETLDIRGMIDNPKSAWHINQACWGEIIRQLGYKCRWHQRKLISIQRHYPSSQICSTCGYRNNAVRDPNIRIVTCPNCKTTYDRDVNAAINILRKAKQIADYKDRGIVLDSPPEEFHKSHTEF